MDWSRIRKFRRPAVRLPVRLPLPSPPARSSIRDAIFSPPPRPVAVAAEIARWEIFFVPPVDWSRRQQVETDIATRKPRARLTICLGDRP